MLLEAGITLQKGVPNQTLKRSDIALLTPGGKVVTRMVGVQRIEDLMNAHNKVQQALKKAGSS